MDFGIDSTPVSVVIMMLTIAASLAAFFVPGFGETSILEPWRIARAQRLHTLITGNLIHANIPHLAFNMLSFYFFAPPLEHIVGSTIFLFIYVGSMLIADIPSILRYKNEPEYKTLGASGAVSGVIFSMILFYPTMRMGLFLLPPIIPAWLFGPLYLAYSFYASRQMSDNINHDAHIWGALGGMLCTIVFVPQSLLVFARTMGFI